ncbi:hypothetical protein [Pediococcus stilesii]|uniref:Uncharacterized protein n=1 Tax=Pediococcus stilesii TaxID=331679 RepID=A0A0R2L1R1_9LACO|nr:hypothetical protein [Pediococcus stilesii]KRN93781.1 hypothetical protein IV81_GL000182 [Pediococcus stilesii]
MKSEDVFQIIGHKTWIFEVINEENNPVVIFLGQQLDQNGYLIIRFEEDGTISFPTRLGFLPPEYRGWRFDEVNQKIIFLNDHGQDGLRASLPIPTIHQNLVINIIGRRAHFLFTPEVDQLEVNRALMGGINIYMIPRQHISQALFTEMDRHNFNVIALGDQSSWLEQLREAYWYLVSHDQVQRVIITQKQMDTTNFELAKKLSFKRDSKGGFRVDYVAGQRGTVLEFLNVLLIRIQKQRVSGTEILNARQILANIIREKFTDRFEVVE